MRSRTALCLALTIAAASACKGNSKESSDEAKRDPASSPTTAEPAEPAAAQSEMADEEGSVGGGQFAGMKRDNQPSSKSAAGEKDQADDLKNADRRGRLADDPDATEGEARTRAWFPETFLFEPLLVTDGQGVASIDVAVPDRLTSWRVLALAHSREGSQAGAVTEFLGTLPAYVDPILPSRLRVGDRLRIPVQIVNTTSEPLRTDLTMSISGGSLAAPPRAVSVPARGALVVYANVTATEVGELRLAATLGATDSVVRTAAVVPVGKRTDARANATLAAPREISLALPGAADRLADRARLEVFPGALAIVRSELSASSSRGGLAADAFALLLAGRAPELLGKLGDEPNGDALRAMTILATQRIIRAARVLNEENAALIAQAALAHPQNAILSGLGLRAVGTLQASQLPDGTCGGVTGWTLQRLIVSTADCARAAADARSLVVRASGAFERHQKLINDPYTAAAILAANGAPDQTFADKLRESVRAAIKRDPSGAAWLEVPRGVVRGDGAAPSVVEATALAVLALADSAADEALVADLGATILAGYSRQVGWGDGRANLVALEALVRVFSAPIPDNVIVELLKDDEVVATGALNAENVRDVMTLEVANVDATSDTAWLVRATPAVPGLGFNFGVASWVKWPPLARDRGLEIDAPVPTPLEVGKASLWRIDAAAPAGAPFVVSLELPAGVQFDRAAIDELVSSGVLSRYQLDDDHLELHPTQLSPGATFSLELPVIATLAGSLQSGPQTISMESISVSAPPVTWNIK